MWGWSFIFEFPKIAPRNSISLTAIFIFVGLKMSPFPWHISNILVRCCPCSLSFSEKTKMSSIYTAMKFSVPLKQLSIFLLLGLMTPISSNAFTCLEKASFACGVRCLRGLSSTVKS
ncbi:unnamed protein product [Musa acuminata subsp. burmannicoides]